MSDTSADRWANFDQLRGFQKLYLDELSRIQREAVLSRHPTNCMYFDDVLMTDAEKDEYDRLNMSLHEKIREVARHHFRDTPLPTEYQRRRKDPTFLQQIGTAFTYQNPDWYGPTYEVYVAVLERYVSAKLLRAFQDLLIAEHRDWCIVVCTCQDVDFDHQNDIILFSDHVLMQKGVAVLLGIP
jgi:hypothetical protein